MRFMRRIGDGEVTIENNEVLEYVNPSVQGENWASQFTKEAAPPEVCAK